ncbi:hypothetical protein [Paenirhodobacter sp.]|uniref:hypothetical protein n=1 Tax=Paenirhodobacter sp. TaxID=1965326 RepID=UPI003B3EFD57
MTDSLHLGPDAQVNHAIASLRSLSVDMPLTDGARIAPGVFLSVDSETGGQVAGNVVTGGDGLLRLSYTIDKRPRWLALHVAMGGVDLSQASVFGVVCKSRAPEAATFRICLRSATADGFTDTFLPKHVVAFAADSTHLDLLRLEGHPDVPARAAWRELILFFQTTSATFDIRDLRVFIV